VDVPHRGATDKWQLLRQNETWNSKVVTYEGFAAVTMKNGT
jgi:hypothetical protein